MTSSNYRVMNDGTVSGCGIATSSGYKNTATIGLLSPVEMTANAAIPGDVNGDKIINVFDALLTLQYSVGLIPHTPDVDALYLASADVAPLDNGKPGGDGAVNVFDALAILRKSVGLDAW